MDLVGGSLPTDQQPEFWQLLADNIPHLAWVADAKGWIYWYNQRWYDYTGTTLEQMQGWGWEAVQHPDHLDRVKGIWSAALAAGEPWEDRFPLRSAAGEYRMFLSRANPIRDGDGRITHWFGTNTDVSDHMHAEAELARSEERLRRATQAAGLFSWESDLRTGVTTWGEGAAGIMGLSERELKETPDGLFMVAEAEKERLQREFAAALQKRVSYYVAEFSSEDGRLWRAEGSVSYGEDGTPERLFGVTKEVTVERAEQRRDRFLLKLEDVLRKSSGAQDAKRSVAALLGRELACSRVLYAEVDAEQLQASVADEWLDTGVPSIAGIHHMPPAIHAHYLRGEPLVAEDMLVDPLLAPARADPLIANLPFRAVLDIPLLRDGRLVAVLAIHDVQPRVWTPAEVELALATAERTWDVVERARVEALLGKSEAQFRTVTEALPGMLFVTSGEGQNSYVNEGFRSYTGRTSEELLGDRWTETLHPDDLAAGWELWSEAVRTGAPYAAEYRFRRHDGEWRWHAVRALPVRGDDATIDRWVGTCIDIHDRREAEDALRRSELRYRALFESMEQGFCTIQVIMEGDEPVDYRFTELNPAFTANSGLSQDVLHRSVRDAVPGLEQTWFDRYGEVARTGRSTRFTEYAESLNRWFDVYAFRIGDLDERNVAILFSDVTAERENQIALENSEARLRAVLEATPVGLVFADPTGRITGGNARVEEIIGKPVVRSGGVADYKDDYVAFHEDGRQVKSDDYPLSKVISGDKERAELVCHVQRPDGSRVWVRYAAAPVLDPDGNILGGVVASIDVNREKLLSEGLEREVERVVAEREIAQEALRQSQKLEAMGQLTGGVAHDFNNLLTPIIGSLDLLHRKQVGDTRTQRLVDGALQSAERAKTLVQRLLAFARRQPLKPMAVDVGRVVTDMNELIVSTSGPKVRVELAVEKGVPAAHADANQLEMALLNLSVNARDAMPDGGVLRIGVMHHDEPPADAPSLNGGGHVVLTVADTGSGMDEETRARAIEPFFSTKGIGKGTGLGLSMVHGLAAQLGGSLRIDSAPGKGTSVELWLPVSGAAEADPVTSARTDSPSGRGIVLLVDDEELVRSSTASMLADLGFTVAEAASAEDALAQVLSGLKPDVLVTDQLMPGISGTDLAVKLRRKMPMLPVLVVSGYADAESLSPGFPHLSKPFRQDELAANVAAVTGAAPTGKRGPPMC